jgi:hypothetical protein
LVAGVEGTIGPGIRVWRHGMVMVVVVRAVYLRSEPNGIRSWQRSRLEYPSTIVTPKISIVVEKFSVSSCLFLGSQD